MIRRTLLLIGAVVCLLAAPLSAQDTRADIAHGTHPILQKLSTLGDKPFECAVDLSFRGEEGEGANGKALVAFSNGRHFSLSFAMLVNDGHSGNQKVSMKIVADGENLFAEVISPDMPQAQAFKVSLDLFDQMMTQDGGMQMPGMGGNPVEQLEQILNLIDLQESKANGGSTTRFTATIDPQKLADSFAAQFGGGIQGADNEKIDLEIDFATDSGFPQAFNMNAGEGSFSIKTSNVRFPESISSSKFKYQVSEGTFLMDLTPMLQMQLDAAAQQGEL